MKAQYLVAFLLLGTVSCKKEAARLTDDLQGKWELVSYDGAWVGHVDYAEGNGNTYIFSGNNFTQQYKTTDTTIQMLGTFKIYTGKPCDFAAEQTLIEFDNIHDNPSSFSLSDGKLSIGTTECIADGGTATYRKISN
jgi:hypothetical protein